MKLLGILSITCSLIISATSVQAQCQGGQAQCHPCHGRTLCELYVAGYCANSNWPRYYIPPARCAVNNAYSAMIANGWRRQNLLGDYHFDPDTNELTKAGKLKAKWVLTQAPQDYRSIYVQRGEDESTTASRIAAVHSWASNQSSVSEPVMVNDTHIVSEGHPAGAVDNVFVGFQTNQPAPILPAASGSGSSSSTTQ